MNEPDELEWLSVPRWWIYMALKLLPADMARQLVQAREDAHKVNRIINGGPGGHRSCIPKR
jgi:hypothetical protein